MPLYERNDTILVTKSIGWIGKILDTASKEKGSATWVQFNRFKKRRLE